MQFDFSLMPGQSQHIDTVGTFVKYKAGAGAIRVRLDGGGYIDLLPGQGVNNVKFTSIDVQDRSGLQNFGTILAGMYDFRDDRITGDVSVIDNAKTRTIVATAFSLATGTTSQAGCMPVCMLWNPANSGKNIYVSRATMSGDQAGQIDAGWSDTTVNATLFSTITAKRAGGTASQMKYCVNSALATTPTNARYLLSMNSPALTPLIYAPVEPLMLPPGYGFYAQHNTTGSKLLMAVDFVEESV